MPKTANNHKISFRVRYGETDQMGVVYHGNYAQYLEMGRVEWLRNLGVSYKALEEKGIMLPVIELNLKFKKPALYDDVLTVNTQLIKIPTVRIAFNYEIRNQKEQLLVTAHTVLAFMDMNKKRPVGCPADILEKLEDCF